MRKNALALGVATALFGIAGVAQAGVVGGPAARLTNGSKDGTGHILVVPYFSTQNGNYSTINIVNTDRTNGKVVKVRFRSGLNSDDVLDFQLLMSPGDVFAAGVTQDATTGLSKLVFKDNTCTQPAGINGQLFQTSRLASTATNIPSQTREGYIEVLNMADIPPSGSAAYTADDGGTAANAGRLYRATKHSAAGVPTCDTTVLNNLNIGTAATTLSTSAVIGDYRAVGMDHPTGGLMANWSIVNVPFTNSYSGEAEALVATDASNVPSAANLVFFPQNGNTLTAAQADVYTADPIFRSAPVKANNAAPAGTLPILAVANVDLPDLSTPYTTAGTSPLVQANSLTSAWATRAVMNEYYVNPETAAATDWTFSMPTRRYHVAMDYYRADREPGWDGRVFSQDPTAAPVLPVAGTPGSGFFRANNTRANGDVICVTGIQPAFWNREEATKTSGVIISPPSPVAGFEACGETSVLAINAPASTTKVLGAEIALKSVTSDYLEGWLYMDSSNTSGTVSPGLPILGSTFMKMVNGAVTPGTSGNFGLVHTHRTNLVVK